MARFPIYTAEDIKIPTSNVVGKRSKKGELLAEATGTRQAPGIELLTAAASGCLSSLDGLRCRSLPNRSSRRV
jgi:hypothetical protein